MGGVSIVAVRTWQCKPYRQQHVPDRCDISRQKASAPRAAHHHFADTLRWSLHELARVEQQSWEEMHGHIDAHADLPAPDPAQTRILKT